MTKVEIGPRNNSIEALMRVKMAAQFFGVPVIGEHLLEDGHQAVTTEGQPLVDVEGRITGYKIGMASVKVHAQIMQAATEMIDPLYRYIG